MAEGAGVIVAHGSVGFVVAAVVRLQCLLEVDLLRRQQGRPPWWYCMRCANPWLIGENLCPWGGVFSSEEGRQGFYSCRSNARSGGGIGHEDDTKNNQA